jgi:hypothetical protein
MFLYCIDNVHNGSQINLTVGNSYEVIRKQHFEVIVRNDKGKLSGYGLNRFADKSEFRQIQLDKILNSK